ncbi:MAG TPA: hypothetical protein VGM50_19655 [Gemmatimonadaceae bacterium]
MLGRALSNEHGVFTIVMRSSHTPSSLRVLRIGFTPATRALDASARDSASLTIALTHIPTQLEAMRVVESKSCQSDGDGNDAVTLWEQARTALLATIVARESKPANAVSVMYTRFVSVDDRRVLSQQTQRRVGTTTRPFKAPTTPEQFAKVGYVEVRADGSRLYAGPDADLLLDPTFAETHCFSVERESRASGAVGTPPRVGLAFRPAQQRESFTDIEGTLWFTSAPLALDALDFRYTGPGDVSDSSRASGELRFRTVANGVSFIDNWFIRIPTSIEQSTHASGTVANGAAARSLNVDRSTQRERRVTQVEEAGGRVVSASWPDGVRTDQNLGSIVGMVTRTETRAAAANIDVTLVADRQTVRTDSVGMFHFADLLPGRYAVALRDTTYQAFMKAPADTISILVDEGARSEARATIAVADSALLRLCRERSKAKESTMLIGQIHSPAFSPAWSVRATWQADYSVVDKRAGAGIAARQLTIKPDSIGNYYVCGAVRERPIHLGVWQDKLHLLDTTVTVYDSLIKRVDLNLWMDKHP